MDYRTGKNYEELPFLFSFICALNSFVYFFVVVTRELIRSQMFTLLMTLDISSHLSKDESRQGCLLSGDVHKGGSNQPQCRLFQKLNTQNALRLN